MPKPAPIPTTELELDREQAHLAGIKNLPKLLVAWELWRFAKPDMAVVNNGPSISSVLDLAEVLKVNAETNQDLKKLLTFVWLDGRNLSCCIAGDFVDLSLYNSANSISGVALINNLKTKVKKIEEANQLNTEQASLLYLADTAYELHPKIQRKPKPAGMVLLDQILFGESDVKKSRPSSKDS